MLPRKADIAAQLKDIRDSVSFDDDTGDYLDVRLQFVPGEFSTIHWGLPCYDSDHRGFWGASAITEEMDETELWEVANDLLSQVEEDLAELGEESEDYPN